MSLDDLALCLPPRRSVRPSGSLYLDRMMRVMRSAISMLYGGGRTEKANLAFALARRLLPSGATANVRSAFRAWPVHKLGNLLACGWLAVHSAMLSLPFRRGLPASRLHARIKPTGTNAERDCLLFSSLATMPCYAGCFA